MKKVEAPTLEEAYREASKVLECSISELQCEVVQHPTKGFFGFLKKNAIIVAICKNTIPKKEEVSLLIHEKNVADSMLTTEKKSRREEHIEQEVSSQERVENETVVDRFFEMDSEYSTKNDENYAEGSVVYKELALSIENQLKALFAASCFEIDVIEVDVIDNTALIFIDGNDAALLIGKEGYRYNALSYMLFNWLHLKYELYIKLEIAEFLTTQHTMIRTLLQPVVRQIEKKGHAKTRFLDGILVQIALEQLREKFPHKYIAVKTAKAGKKFILINEFHTRADE